MKSTKLQINMDRLEEKCENLDDTLEFLGEIFKECEGNHVCIRLLTNALLQYCYLPVVLPVLVGVAARHEKSLASSTALYVVH